MASDIWSKKDLTEFSGLLFDKLMELEEREMRTARLVSLIFSKLPKDDREDIFKQISDSDIKEEVHAD